MKDEIIELTALDQKINALIFKAGYFIQTYRAIDALNVLAEAHRMMEGQEVHWRVKTAVLNNTGQAHILLGNLKQGLECFALSYDIIEDGNEKASAAAHLSGYFLRDHKLDEAMKWADKALETVSEPDFMAGPYQIKGGIAAERGDYPKAIELLNKAANYAEESHCMMDLAMIISDIAAVFFQMGKLETALSEMFRAERYAKESRNFDLMLRFAVRRAKLMYKMGKDEEAKALIMTLDEQKN